MVGPDDSWLNGVTITGGRPPRPPSITHFLISLFSPRGRPRPVWRHLPSDPFPLSYPSWVFLCSLPFFCSSAFPPSVSLLLHFFSLFIHGVQPVVLPPLRWNSFLCRLPTAGPMELPHMLHHSPTSTAPIREKEESLDMKRTHSTLSSRGSPSLRSLSTGPSSPAQTNTSAPGQFVPLQRRD